MRQRLWSRRSSVQSSGPQKGRAQCPDRVSRGWRPGLLPDPLQLPGQPLTVTQPNGNGAQAENCSSLGPVSSHEKLET